MLLRLAASKVKSITDAPGFAVMYNTWRIGGAPVGRQLVAFGSVNLQTG